MPFWPTPKWRSFYTSEIRLTHHPNPTLPSQKGHTFNFYRWPIIKFKMTNTLTMLELKYHFSHVNMRLVIHSLLLTLSIIVVTDNRNALWLFNRKSQHHPWVSLSIPKAYELSELDVKIWSSTHTPRINCEIYIHGMFQPPPKSLH